MKQVMDQLRGISQKNIFARVALYTLVGCMALTSCNGKDRPIPPEPTPPPTPTPTPNGEIRLALSLTNGGVIADGKLGSDWTSGDKVSLWGYTSESNNPIKLIASFKNNRQWSLNNNIPKDWNKTGKLFIGYLPAGSYNAETKVFTPKIEAKKVIGSFEVSPYYEDVLLTSMERPTERIYTTLNSPYKQLQVILQNSKYSKQINNISLEIEGALMKAEYRDNMWNGSPVTMSVSYRDKDREWQGEEADEIYLAVPTAQEKLKAILTYKDKNGKDYSIEREVSIEGNGVTTLQFIFPEEAINNPPLEFNPPIDVAYWKKANQDAYNLVMSNYKGELDEETMRLLDFVVSRPLVDEAMHSKQLYKDDMNLIRWATFMKEHRKSDKADWGFAYGLEDINSGKIVEIYPPNYQNEIGGYAGGIWYLKGGSASFYYYVTAPAGKYRLVLFMSFPEYILGEKDTWYRIPIMDSLTLEALNGKKPYEKRVNEPISISKSIYKDIDIIEVVDRKPTTNVAPRWYLGYLYANQNDCKNHKPLNDGINKMWNYYKVGQVLGITAVNHSNQTLRGTIVVKAEYLPMFNPIGYWRLEQTAKYHNTHGKGGSFYYTSWSREVGRADVLLHPNKEEIVSIEITQYDEKWKEIAGRGYTNIGPDYFIHFYWVDETGNETMMMRIDYPMVSKLQQKGWAYYKGYFIEDVDSQSAWESPECNGENYANGFLM